PEHRKALCAESRIGTYAGESSADSIYRRPSWGFRIRSFRCPWDCKPIESAGLCGDTFAGEWTCGYVQAIRERHSAEAPARSPGHHLNLLWIRPPCIRGRGTRGAVLGVSTRWRTQCDWSFMGSQRCVNSNVDG